MQTNDKRLATHENMIDQGLPWVVPADSSTTFPARVATVPAWWTGKVQYNSVAYLDHPDPTDAVEGDTHKARKSPA